MYRRVLAVAGSAVIGLIGAVALSSPASAHHTEVTGVPYCDTETGEWVVTWTVDSFAPSGAPTYRLLQVEVTPAGSWVSNIEATKGQDFPHASGVPLVGEQRLPGDATSASLAVRAMWSGTKFEETELKTGEVRFDGTCEKPPAAPGVTSASTCDELTVIVTNPEDGAAITAQVTTSAGDSKEIELEPGASDSVDFPATEGLTYEVTVDGAVIGSGAWQNPGECDLEPSIASQPDCDSLTIEVTNPFDEAIEATVTSGDVTETVPVEPGQTGEITIDAEAGTVATVTAGDTTEEIAWTEPADCDGGGGGLPVTGAPTGVVIGAALALLAAGGGLFLLARRRRITFTA
jgi:LPXTG-motif cell wall-anchored protein